MNKAEQDKRFMAAAIRLAERHIGLTGENPSVGALIVQNKGAGASIVGYGVTAIQGRPHAEVQALLMAGPLAYG
ncbi:MAG: riboflavin biosynthesis protein RibD, partial [Bartonella sp.]|nr:riboflavin biosynthesis protein RibD [Bartonella sp.]